MSFLDETVNLDEAQNIDVNNKNDDGNMEKKVILLKKLRDKNLELTNAEDPDEKEKLQEEIKTLKTRLESIDPAPSKSQDVDKEEKEKVNKKEEENEEKKLEEEEMEEKKTTEETKEHDGRASGKRTTMQAHDNKKAWKLLRSTTHAVGFEDKILQSQHEKNKKAVIGFSDRYEELLKKVDPISTTDAAGTAHKPLPHLTLFIQNCHDEKINLLQDGDFHFGNHVPFWHFQAAVDALMAGARIAGSPASFRLTRRKYNNKETSAIEDFIVGCDDIDTFAMEHVWGFDTTKDYAVNLVRCLAEATKLRNLEFNFVATAENKTKIWWEEVAALVSKHATLESVSFAFTRPRPLIAHNVMEKHYEQNPEILESLIISISNNRKLKDITLECVGLTTDDARQIGRMMKKLKLVRLKLPRNSLGRIGAETISKQLRMCKTIVELNVSANNIEDAGVIAIIMACQDHPTIQRLGIAANDLTSAIIPSLCDYVKSSTRLIALDVSHNYIGREIIRLLHAVAMSQTLMTLNIAYNAGSESCVGALKHVLMNPLKTDDDPDPIPAAPQLTELNLQGNQLSPEAGVVIRHALKTNMHILHINLEANFVSKHDVTDIEQQLSLNRQGAAFKFRFEPGLLHQKWNLSVTNVDGKKNVRENKKIHSRMEEDSELKKAKEKKKRERIAKNGKLKDPPSCFIL